MERQYTEPVFLGEDHKRRRYWLFTDRFYWENEGLDSDDVYALLIERERKQRRRIDRAHAYVAGTDSSTASREPIRDDVKTAVWQRDKGRCVECGSKERLEYDHIIPVSMGGANTARNIQLLCEACNRSKGGNLA